MNILQERASYEADVGRLLARLAKKYEVRKESDTCQALTLERREIQSCGPEWMIGNGRTAK